MVFAMCVYGRRDALLLGLKVFLASKHCGRQASLTSVVSAKVELSGVVMRRNLRYEIRCALS
jgi:hypothetical protein